MREGGICRGSSHGGRGDVRGCNGGKGYHVEVCLMDPAPYFYKESRTTILKALLET